MELLVGDVLRAAAARHPGRPAVAVGDESLTFRELDGEARACAARLMAAGVGHGDRVGWVARNSIEGAVIQSACAYMGAVYSPFNPASTGAELAALVEVTRPAIVLSLDGREGTRRFDSLPAATVRDDALPTVSEHDAMVIFLTSGTTGLPKGAMLSHRVERLRGGFEITTRGTHVSMFPQFHMAGWVSTLDSWNRGDLVVWVDRPEPELLFAAIERHRAFSTYLIPAVWRRVLDADRTGWDLSSLTIADTGTSATSPELLGGIKDAFPTTVTSVVYGSTEAHKVCVLQDPDLFTRPYAVGRPCPGVFIRRDEAGELWVRSPLVFSGYFENPTATDEALVDGWYRTGDVVEQDADGVVSVVGRTKELIRTGGETVAPAEVDEVLRRCAGLLDAAVAGVPDPDWGEVVTAFVVVAPGASVTLESLQAEASQHLTRHKVPRRMVVVDAIPRTGATGQVSRAALIGIAEGRPT
ncbi:MAG TPA: AMP-binding protein [Acidimicrobiales bacterium]